MIRWMFAAALAVLLAGCMPIFQAPAGPTVQSLQDPVPASQNEIAPAAATAVPAAVQAAPEVADNPTEATAAEGEDATATEASDGPVDAETLEDNAALTGADQAAPDEAGVSVPAEEVTFDLPVVENAKVRYFLDYYSGPGRSAFSRWLARSSRYLPRMREIFAKEGLPQDLAYLAMIESGFNDRAFSWARAVGPWQFIDSTGRLMGLKSDWWRDERRDFEKSTEAAARFLKDLHDRFDGDWYLAVASYNAGPGKLMRAMRKYDSHDFWQLSRGKYLQAETKNYVPKLLAAMLIAKEPQKYGFTDIDYAEPLAYETVTVPSATDLEIVARLCGVDYEQIKLLNPELKRWCTPPGEKDYQLRIPAGSRKHFLVGYATLPADQRANYKHHRIKRGDTLLALAKHYGIRVDDIITLNRIKNPRVLTVGTDLVLPLSKNFTRLPVEELKADYVRTRRQTYRVRNGDNLWKIARRFDVSEKQLRVWNRLGWSNVIRPGQTLLVSAKAARRTRPVHTAARAKSAPSRKVVYKVRPGDTLWGIGRQFDVAASQIQDWNNLSADHVLHPGQTLTLLVPATDNQG
jgi:peptidoglycan lytic transglycosylase D